MYSVFCTCIISKEIRRITYRYMGAALTFSPGPCSRANQAPSRLVPRYLNRRYHSLRRECAVQEGYAYWWASPLV